MFGPGLRPILFFELLFGFLFNKADFSFLTIFKRRCDLSGSILADIFFCDRENVVFFFLHVVLVTLFQRLEPGEPAG